MLKGAVFFLADLMRQLEVDCEVDFMAVSSYGSSTDSSGVVRILKDLDASIEGRDVLIVEDIVDSGLTLSLPVPHAGRAQPASLEVCALLTKPERREVDLPIRYVGFEIPNQFAIGYGLDHAERYRNLPYVAVLERVPRHAGMRRYNGELRLIHHCYACVSTAGTRCREQILQERRVSHPDRRRSRVLRPEADQPWATSTEPPPTRSSSTQVDQRPGQERDAQDEEQPRSTSSSKRAATKYQTAYPGQHRAEPGQPAARRERARST